MKFEVNNIMRGKIYPFTFLVLEVRVPSEKESGWRSVHQVVKFLKLDGAYMGTTGEFGIPSAISDDAETVGKGSIELAQLLFAKSEE